MSLIQLFVASSRFEEYFFYALAGASFGCSAATRKNILQNFEAFHYHLGQKS